MYATPLHQISFIYSRMHIYPWQSAPLNQPYISGTPLHCISCSITYVEIQTYPASYVEIGNAHIPKADIHPPMTIGLYNTTTPNHLSQNTDISSTNGPCWNMNISSADNVKIWTCPVQMAPLSTPSVQSLITPNQYNLLRNEEAPC